MLPTDISAAAGCDEVFRDQLVRQRAANSAHRINQVKALVQQRMPDECPAGPWDPVAITGSQLAKSLEPGWGGTYSGKGEGARLPLEFAADNGQCASLAPKGNDAPADRAIGGMAVPPGIRELTSAGNTEFAGNTGRDGENNIVVYFSERADQRPSDGAACWMYVSGLGRWASAEQTGEAPQPTESPTPTATPDPTATPQPRPTPRPTPAPEPIVFILPTVEPVPAATRPATPATGAARMECWGNWHRDADAEESQERAMENRVGSDVEFRIVTMAPVPDSPDQEVRLHLVCEKRGSWSATGFAWLENATGTSLRWGKYLIAPWDTKREGGPGETSIEEHIVESYAESTDDKGMVSISNTTGLRRIIAAMRHTNTSEALLLHAEIKVLAYQHYRMTE